MTLLSGYSTTSVFRTFLVIFCVFHRIDANFKIVLIGDQTADHARFSEYVNASVSFISDRLDFEFIQVDDDVEKSYQDVCGTLDDDAVFLISVSEKASVVSAVKSISYQSGIPTIQLQYGPWLDYQSRTPIKNDGENALSTGSTAGTVVEGSNITNGSLPAVKVAPPTNYVTIVPPWISMLAVIRDFVARVNMTETNIIYDKTFKLDSAMMGMLSNIGLKFTLVPMETNETDIRRQINDLKQKLVKSNFLISDVPHMKAYFAVAKPEMETNRFTWLGLTKDSRPLQCEECTALNVLTMAPVTDDHSFQRLEEFKDYILKKLNTPDLYDGLNQLDLSFFLDITDIAWETIQRLNSTAQSIPEYFCQNSSSINQTITLNEILDETYITGGYGEYMRYKESAYFPNVPISFRSCNHAESRQCKKMGNWTATQGITEVYDTLMQDITKIRHYRVAIVVQPPFIQPIPDQPGEYEGYCIDLINAIKEGMGFNYTLYEVKDKMYGTINEKGEWNGLIGELVSGEAEIALAPLSVMAERENFVDFTVPYYDLVGTTILMKKMEPGYSLFKFMTVLEAPVWGCIVGAYFFTSFLLWIFDRFSPYSYTNNKEKYQDDPEKREFTFKECLWFCMTSLTPQGGGEAPKNISGRLVAATWWLFGFIIIASYTANLAAFLTVSRLETPIASLDDLAKQYKIKYAPVRGTASETYFRRMAEIEEKFYDIWKAMSLNESMSPQERAQLAVWDYPVSDKFTNMWRYMQEAELPNSTEQAIKRVLASQSDTEGFAYIGDATEIRYAELINCQLQMIGNEFSRKPYAIAVQQLSPLKDSISSEILKLLNKRTLELLKERWWTRNKYKKNCPKAEEESDGISIQNIGGVFIVILVGIALSIITLAFEYWYYKDKRQGPSDNNNIAHIDTKPTPINVRPSDNGNRDINYNNGIHMGHFNTAFSKE